MYLLDTNICIYIIKQKPIEIIKRFKEIDIGNIAISSITLSELEYGVFKSRHKKKNIKALEMFITPLIILPYDAKSAGSYGILRAELEKKGTPIGSMDTLIAAHAISEQCILVTNNEKEFCRIKELKVENWIKKQSILVEPQGTRKILKRCN